MILCPYTNHQQVFCPQNTELNIASRTQNDFTALSFAHFNSRLHQGDLQSLSSINSSDSKLETSARKWSRYVREYRCAVWQLWSLSIQIISYLESIWVHCKWQYFTENSAVFFSVFFFLGGVEFHILVLGEHFVNTLSRWKRGCLHCVSGTKSQANPSDRAPLEPVSPIIPHFEIAVYKENSSLMLLYIRLHRINS